MTEATPLPAIPDKLYFKIGEVSDLVGVPAYVLRFWESEFKQLRPKRTASGQRLYRKRDVELVLQIKDLLYNQKLTIPGANRCIRSGTPPPLGPEPTGSLLDEIRAELIRIRNLLE